MKPPAPVAAAKVPAAATQPAAGDATGILAMDSLSTDDSGSGAQASLGTGQGGQGGGGQRLQGPGMHATPDAADQDPVGQAAKRRRRRRRTAQRDPPGLHLPPLGFVL
jgi:hypothetical protein